MQDENCSVEFLQGAKWAADRAQIGRSEDPASVIRALRVQIDHELAAAEAREAAQPSAAEVIEACRVALEQTLTSGELPHREDDKEVCFEWCPACLRDAAIAAIAEWKEGMG